MCKIKKTLCLSWVMLFLAQGSAFALTDAEMTAFEASVASLAEMATRHTAMNTQDEAAYQTARGEVETHVAQSLTYPEASALRRTLTLGALSAGAKYAFGDETSGGFQAIQAAMGYEFRTHERTLPQINEAIDQVVAPLKTPLSMTEFERLQTQLDRLFELRRQAAHALADAHAVQSQLELRHTGAARRLRAIQEGDLAELAAISSARR